MTKAYTSQGVQVDGNFDVHEALCSRCYHAERGGGSALGGMCLEGSILYKREHHIPRKTVAPVTTMTMFDVEGKSGFRVDRRDSVTSGEITTHTTKRISRTYALRGAADEFCRLARKEGIDAFVVDESKDD